MMNRVEKKKMRRRVPLWLITINWRMRKKEKFRVRARVCGAKKVIEVWLYIYVHGSA